MKPTTTLRFLGSVFAICLVSYVSLFQLDQWLRNRRGPWIVHFTLTEQGTPALAISQPALGIDTVRVVFTGETATNAPTTVRFDQPRPSIPFGSVVFTDTTYLPGTVTLNLFGHEVELLPRTLIVNRQEHAWSNSLALHLHTNDKPATLPAPPPNPGPGSTRPLGFRPPS